MSLGGQITEKDALPKFVLSSLHPVWARVTIALQILIRLRKWSFQLLRCGAGLKPKKEQIHIKLYEWPFRFLLSNVE